MNSKANTGEVLSMFAATIAIVAILILFVILSGAIKAFEKEKIGRDDKESNEIKIKENYMPYFQNLEALRVLQNSGLNEEIDKWSKENINEILAFIENSRKSAGINEIYIEKENIGKIFCDEKKCEEGEENFDGTMTSEYSLNPELKIKISVK